MQGSSFECIKNDDGKWFKNLKVTNAFKIENEHIFLKEKPQK